MSEESFEKQWKTTLVDILEELSGDQYKKTVLFLNIPRCKKSVENRAELAQVLIEHLGANGSIRAIRDAMEKVPRNDEAVQEKLRPFVAKLENEEETEQKKNAVQKRKGECGAEEQTSTDGPEQSEVSSSRHSTQESSDAEQTERPPKKHQSWKISIRDLISSGQDKTKKAILAKVIQKSGVSNYKTKDHRSRSLFHLAIADETDCIKVVVYGKEHYKKYSENKCYLFRDIILDLDMQLFRVTRDTPTSRTTTVDIPEDIQLRAQMLIYTNGPVCSIADVLASSHNKPVNVEGVIEKIHPLKRCTGEHIERKDFRLGDGGRSILISLWRAVYKQLHGKREGDTVRVTYVKPNRFYESTTLNSTAYTRVITVQRAPVQNVSIEIIGVIKANKQKTHLDASLGEEVRSFVVASKLLAEAFGLRLENLEEQLLDRIPLSAKAEVQGSKINALTATTEE